DGEEGHRRLAGNSLGQQCLAGARWADQQHALGNARPEPSILLRILEEVDDLNQLRLGFINASDIGKGHAGILLHEYLCTALANAQEAPHALFLSEASEQEEPDPKEDYARQNRRQDVAQPGAFHHAGVGHAILRQAIRQIGFDAGGHDRRLATAVRRFQAPGDRAVRHQYFGDTPFRQRLLEFTVWYGLDRLSGLPVALQHQQQQDRDDPVTDIPLIFLLHNRYPSRIESLT